MGKEKTVIKYETRQRDLKKLVKKKKKKIPISIFGFILFSIALITLLDGKLKESVGNSYNLIVVVSTFFILLSTVYTILMSIKIKRINKEIKSLGEKLYNKMKL